MPESNITNTEAVDRQHAVVENGGLFQRFLDKGGGMLIAAGGLVVVGLVAHSCVSEVPATPNQPQAAVAPPTPDHCPPTNIDTAQQPGVELQQARESVSKIRFAITSMGYMDKLGDIARAQDSNGIANILNGVTDDKITVSFNNVPDNINTQINPSGVSIEEAKRHADEYMQLMSKVPQSFIDKMPKTNLYLVTDLKDKDGHGLDATWGVSANRETYLIINAPHDATSQLQYDSIEHSLSAHIARLVEVGLCGNGAQSDEEFANINKQPGYNPDFTAYTSDPDKLYQFFGTSMFQSPWGRTGVLADVSTVGGGMLENGYTINGVGYYPDHNLKPIDQKREMLIARQATIEPNIRDYYAYLGYLEGRPFPQYAASSAEDTENKNPIEATLSECIASVPPRAKNADDVDAPITNWVTMSPDTIGLQAVHQSWDDSAWYGRGAHKVTYAYTWKNTGDKDTDETLRYDYERQVEADLIRTPHVSLAWGTQNGPLVTVNGKPVDRGLCSTVSVHFSNTSN